jgi:hypothetical protein
MRRLRKYIQELKPWLNFDWDRKRLTESLAAVRHEWLFGRKRSHRASHRGYESCSVGTEFPALLQHVGADSAGAPRLLDGFEGKLTTSKWAKLAKCSQDTATRDILALVHEGALKRNAEGGRSHELLNCSRPIDSQSTN